MNKRDFIRCGFWILIVIAAVVSIQWEPVSVQWNLLYESEAAREQLGTAVTAIWTRLVQWNALVPILILILVPGYYYLRYLYVRKDRDFQQERRAELRAGYELLELSGEGDHVVGLAVKVHTQAKDALRRDTDALIADSGESGDHQGLVDAVKLANLGVDRIKAVMAEARAALDAPVKKRVGVVALKRLLSAT